MSLVLQDLTEKAAARAAQARQVTKQTAVDRVEATIRTQAQILMTGVQNCEGRHTVPSSERAKQAAQKRRESGNKRRSGGASKPFTTVLSHAPRASEPQLRTSNNIVTDWLRIKS